MIICITGPTGAGKTDTSWALTELASPMVFWIAIGSRREFLSRWNSESDVESVFKLISLMLDFHVGRGIKRFVIPLTVEMAFCFRQFRHYFERYQLPVVTMQLICSENELRQRVQQRDRDAKQREDELLAIQTHRLLFKRLVQEFPAVNTSNIDEIAVAKKIWSAASAAA